MSDQTPSPSSSNQEEPAPDFYPHEEWIVTLPAKVQHIQIAERVWEQMLTRDERQKLGGRFVDAHEMPEAQGRFARRTIGMVRRARGLSLDDAIVQIARFAGLIDRYQDDFLTQRILEAKAVDPPSSPEMKASELPHGQSERAVTQSPLGPTGKSPHPDEPLPEFIEELPVKINALRKEYRLLLVHGLDSAMLYWNGSPVTADWQGKAAQWKLLLRLVDASMRDVRLSAVDLELSGGALRTQRVRLGQLLPDDLLDLIDTTPQGMCVRLPRNHMYIRMLDPGETMSADEWPGLHDKPVDDYGQELKKGSEPLRGSDQGGGDAPETDGTVS